MKKTEKLINQTRYYGISSKYIIFTAIGLSIFYWLAESFLHVVAFNKENISQELFHPGSHELWMRMVVVTLIWAIGLFYLKTTGIVQKHLKEQEKAELKLSHQLQLERFVSKISSDFIELDPDHFNEKMENALSLLGKLTNADRGRVFLLSKDKKFANNVIEWCADGLEPLKDRLQNIPIEKTKPWFTKQIMAGKLFLISDIAKLPDEANSEREFFSNLDIQSLISLPMPADQSIIGFIGLESVHRKNAWALIDQDIFRLVGEIFSQAINRHLKEAALRDREAKLRMITDNTSTLIAILNSKGEYEFASPSHRLMGYEPEELINSSGFELIHPDEIPKFASILDQGNKNQVSRVTLEYKALDKKGNPHYYYGNL